MPISDRCSQVRSLLPQLAAGEVTPTQADACRIHMAACAACRTESDAAVQAHRVLSAYRPAPPPPGLDRRICHAARATRARRWSPLRWAHAGGVLAAAAAVAACVQYSPVFRGGRTEAVAPVAPQSRPIVASPTKARVGRPQEPVLDAIAPAAPETSVVKASEASARSVRYGSPIRRRRARRAVQPTPASFMDVRDASGVSARQIMARLREPSLAAGVNANAAPDRSAGAAGLRPGRNAVPGHPVYETQSSEGSVQVGRRRVRTSAEAGWDAQGRLSVIRLGAEPEADPGRTPK
ncbi:MAG: zf-HC2 domain-containing protein [Armatimonadetes bacterium]|nr:zf-HC2 domain-containing protein [Armatimonadota bacterium]